jgi:CII-binding regulator of phage lambda lysogenization HflD
MKYIRDIEQENRELKNRIEDLEIQIEMFNKEKEDLLLQLASKTKTD